jgi:hypothetical protein
MGWTSALAIYGAGLATANVVWAIVSQKNKKRDDRRTAGSRAIGGVRLFLWKIEPEAFVGGIAREHVKEAIDQHSDFLDSTRQDLEALRVADGRQSVAVAAEAVIETLTDAFGAVVWALRERSAATTDWDRLNAKYDAAKTAAEELEKAVSA